MANKLTNVKALELVLEMDFDNQELRDKLTKMKESFERKNSTGSETTRQKENKMLKDKILEVVDFDEKLTITQIVRKIPQEVIDSLTETDGLSNQRTTNLVGQLVKDGKMVRTIDGRKTFFFKCRLED